MIFKLGWTQEMKWYAPGDDFGTFLRDFVAGLPRLSSLPYWASSDMRKFKTTPLRNVNDTRPGNS